MTSFRGSHLDRRTVLLATASAVGLAALPGGSGAAADYPPNWPDLEPYGRADVRPELLPGESNQLILPLEERPRDQVLGRVWIRDTYVNRFEVDGESVYVATGTTRAAGQEGPGPWNDGIFVWVASSVRGPWKLVDTTEVRPKAEKGKVWSPEFVGENRPGRTVVAPWQEYVEDNGTKRGDVWAPEVHYFRGTWYIVACMGDQSRKVGSFLLISEGGVAGPYRLAEGNRDKPFGDLVGSAPPPVDPKVYYHIDGGLHTEGDDAWLVLHNDFYAKFRDDMEDIVPTTNLPRFQQTRYSPEPYLEGASVFRYRGKYYLSHAAWDRKSTRDGADWFAYEPPAPGRTPYQYDMVMAVADDLEGPYSERWTAGVGIGHNNVFTDHEGGLWATFFRNPVAGYWHDKPMTAVPGVVRMEWTGPTGDRLYVRRP